MSFMDDYRAYLQRAGDAVANAIPPTVGIEQRYAAVPKPYMRWDYYGVTVVMPRSMVGLPPEERPVLHDETTDRWVLNPAGMEGGQSRLMNVGDKTYRVTTSGRVFEQSTIAPPSDFAAASAKGLESQGLVTEKEVTGDAVPVTIQKTVPHFDQKQAAAQAKAQIPESAGGTMRLQGVTSPGGIRIPDAPNPDNFYGSDYLAKEEGMSSEEISTYRALPPNLQAQINNAPSPAYERNLYDKANAEGLGRPMYAPDSGGSVSAIVNTLPPKLLLQVQMMMMRAGYLPSTFVPSPIASSPFREGFAEVLTDANLNGRSWESVLSLMSRKGTKYGPTAGGSSGSGGPQTTTSTQISLTSRSSAEQLVRDAWMQQYGQAPTESQMADFTAALRGAERSDPTTTTTTYTKSGDSSSVTKQSEVDPTAEATDFARGEDPKARKEYLALQYFNLLNSATGAA